MHSASGKADPRDGGGKLSRRELLRLAAAAGRGGVVGPALAGPLTGSTGGGLARPWWMSLPDTRSRVLDVRSPRVLNSNVADRVTLGRMLERALQTITDENSTTAAWQRVLGESRRIAVKFNSVGAELINTNAAVAEVLVEQLKAAGYAPDTVTLVEVPDYLNAHLGTQVAPGGWGDRIGVGDYEEPLAAYLLEADAVINVPFLKTHQVAGMSGCMKNLSHAVIRHPARHHGNGCSPAVAQVIGSQPVSARLKLNIVNALRIVVDKGPDAEEQHLEDYGGLLVGFDPVACDSVGLGLLAVERRRRNINGPVEVRYLSAAGDRGVGRWHPADIRRTGLIVTD